MTTKAKLKLNFLNISSDRVPTDKLMDIATDLKKRVVSIIPCDRESITSPNENRTGLHFSLTPSEENEHDTLIALLKKEFSEASSIAILQANAINMPIEMTFTL